MRRKTVAARPMSGAWSTSRAIRDISLVPRAILQGCSRLCSGEPPPHTRCWRPKLFGEERPKRSTMGRIAETPTMPAVEVLHTGCGIDDARIVSQMWILRHTVAMVSLHRLPSEARPLAGHDGFSLIGQPVSSWRTAFAQGLPFTGPETIDASRTPVREATVPIKALVLCSRRRPCIHVGANRRAFTLGERLEGRVESSRWGWCGLDDCPCRCLATCEGPFGRPGKSSLYRLSSTLHHRSVQRPQSSDVRVEVDPLTDGCPSHSAHKPTCGHGYGVVNGVDLIHRLGLRARDLNHIRHRLRTKSCKGTTRDAGYRRTSA